MFSRALVLGCTAHVLSMTAGMALAQVAAGNNPPIVEVVRSSRTGEVVFIRGVGGASIATRAAANAPAPTPLDFLSEHGGAFGIQDVAAELIQSSTRTDNIGATHTTYEQVYKGIPVFTGIVKVHQDITGAYTGANGRFRAISPKVPVAPLIDSAAAAAIARQSLSLPTAITEKSRLVVVDTAWYGDPPSGQRLAYYLIMVEPSARVREGFFIDSHSGAVLDRWTMVESLRNRKIYNADFTSAIPGTLVRSEGDPPVGPPEYDINKAYDFSGDTYDFYFRAFEKDSFDDAGAVMATTTQWSSQGTCPNAFWYLGQTTFCYGVVTDDIVGHEFTHAVTEYSAGLIYQNQSGALNESMSDIFGELIDLWNGNAAFAGPPGGSPSWPLPSPSGPGTDSPNQLRSACTGQSGSANGMRWLLGEDAAGFGGAIRDMWQPTCFGHPDRANSLFMVCDPTWDNGGVHINSGVPNHCFAILMDGKSFNGQDVTGIGPIKAGAIWYRALTTYLTASSDFEDCFLALKQSAIDLIGTAPNDPRTGLPSDSVITADDAFQVELACFATEMNGPGRCLDTDNVVNPEPAPICTNRTTLFSDHFENGVNGWASFVSTPTPPTPYIWQQASDLPALRDGTAWFCADPNIGDCIDIDQSALHTLISPLIAVPDTPKDIHVAFVHLMMSEGAFDGGRMSYSIDNGDTWNAIPRESVKLNPYNGRLHSSFIGNTNPLAGQESWTGASASWGTTIITDNQGAFRGKSGFFRFEFGNVGWTGSMGWFVDDFEVYICLDCAHDGIPNIEASHVSIVSPTFDDIAGGFNQQFDILGAPPATTDVILTALSSADWVDLSRYLDVRLNSTLVATLFYFSEGSCTSTPERVVAEIPMDVFNAARDPGTGNLVVNIEPSAAVGSSGFCPGLLGHLGLSLQYDTTPETCAATTPLVLADLEDTSVCFGDSTAPLGPEPLVTGGTPPYTYFWRVIQGPSSFGPNLAIAAHPTLTPTEQVEHTVQVQITDSSAMSQQVVGQFKIRVGSPIEVDPGYYLRYHPVITVGEVLTFADQFTVTGGIQPYTYVFSIVDNPNDGGAINDTDPANASFVATKPGTYLIKAVVREFGGCTGETVVAVTADANAPMSRTNSNGGSNGDGTASDPCGVGTALCAPTGIVTIAGCMIGFGWIRGRWTRRRRR